MWIPISVVGLRAIWCIALWGAEWAGRAATWPARRVGGGEGENDLGHGPDGDRGYRLRGGRAGGADFDLPVGQGGEEAGCHLGTASVVDADEHDGGAVRHGFSFSGWGHSGPPGSMALRWSR